MRRLSRRSRALPVFGLSALLCFSPFTAAIAQAPLVLYVDDDAPGDPGPGDPAVSDPMEDGSASHPFDRIQEALDLATPDTTVHLMPGLWTETMRVPPDGCRIEGSGTAVTMVRQPAGQVLDTGLLGVGVTPGVQPRASLRDLALEGDVGFSAPGNVLSSLALEEVEAPATVQVTLKRLRDTGRLDWREEPGTGRILYRLKREE